MVWNAPLRVSVEGGVGVVKNNFVLDSKWSKLSWGGVVKTIIDFFNKLGHFLLCNVPLRVLSNLVTKSTLDLKFHCIDIFCCD